MQEYANKKFLGILKLVIVKCLLLYTCYSQFMLPFLKDTFQLFTEELRGKVSISPNMNNDKITPLSYLMAPFKSCYYPGVADVSCVTENCAV